MTARGRKPKPTQLKKLEGNPGKRKLNRDEPKLSPALPDPPQELTAIALAEWNRVAPELFAAKILTKADRAALAAYCQAWADWLEARSHLDQPDGFTQTTEKGYEQQSAWVGIANTAMNNFMKIASEFGLTPSARTRLSVNPMPDDPEEDLAKRIMD